MHWRHCGEAPWKNKMITVQCQKKKKLREIEMTQKEGDEHLRSSDEH